MNSLLMFFLFLKSLLYRYIWYWVLLFRNLSLAGGLLMILVENRPDSKSLFVGVPNLGDGKDKMKNYLQLVSRVLLLLNFFTKIAWEWEISNVLITIFHGILMVLVVAGYKTKLSALVLVLILTFMNFYSYSFFLLSMEDRFFFYRKYYFFQNMSAIGGLLYIVALGPGGVSLDEKKKDW